MIRGLYTGQSGMLAQWHKMNVIANNLSNINTNGYKKEATTFKAFPEMLVRRLDDNGVVKMPHGSYDKAPLVGKLGTGVELNNVRTQFEQGSLKNTQNDFDLALFGKGFFSVRTQKGERYTRNGSFTIDKNGFLVTQEGFRVQGKNGDIRIKEHNFKVNEFGQIFENKQYKAEKLGSFTQKETNSFERPAIIDELRIVHFYDDRMLKKEGSSFYAATKYSEPPTEMIRGKGRPQVLQGYLETSNVNPIVEMTKMIETQRSYEANQKVIASHDQLLGRAVNELAKI